VRAPQRLLWGFELDQDGHLKTDQYVEERVVTNKVNNMRSRTSMPIGGRVGTRAGLERNIEKAAMREKAWSGSMSI